MSPADLLVPALQEAAQELLRRDRLQCIDIAASILEQVILFKDALSASDVVELKSIPTDNPTEFAHAWVEINGVAIDPDRDEKTQAGDEVRQAIAQAESAGTIQTNNQGLLRAMSANLSRLK